ncbi:hypothetical protein JNW90_28945, partial [Micromonospora sp. STR1s_5]|nr:hypothetical protein [Micromonospora sp. STR1s_5]
MPLLMSRPFKHPKTGIYWFRKAVPADLRPIVGKREEKRSLGTRDPDKARGQHARVLVEVEERWAKLRAGPKSLTEREAHEIARVVHDEWLAFFHDNPSLQFSWQTGLYPTLWTAPLLPEIAPKPGVPGQMPITNVFYRS